MFSGDEGRVGGGGRGRFSIGERGGLGDERSEEERGVVGGGELVVEKEMVGVALKCLG